MIKAISKFFQKSFIPNVSFIFGSLEGGNASLDITHYVKSSPVFTATKMIADAASSIGIIVKDTSTGELNYNHPALALLKNPNPFTTGNLLIKELMSFYILTGNTYLKQIGGFKPLELYSLNPAGITIEPSIRDGFPEIYTYSWSGYTTSFRRDTATKKFLDSVRNQVAQLRDFNPEYSSSNLIGLSTFAGCAYEVVLGVTANIHNTSLIKNQGRPSGLLTHKGETKLGDDQVKAVQQIVEKKMAGAQNAGKINFLNGEFTWQQLSENIKDMDFPALNKSTAEAVFKAAEIPLAMVSPDNMSFANMDASKYAFYDRAVLPKFKILLEFLTTQVLKRFPNSENLIFTYDESAIESLQLRKLEYATKLYQSGLGTRTEGREQIGYEDLDGQEKIFYSRASNSFPNGSDSGADSAVIEKAAAKAIGKAEYVKLATSIKDINGDRLYSDDVIKENVKTFYDND